MVLISCQFACIHTIWLHGKRRSGGGRMFPKWHSCNFQWGFHQNPCEGRVFWWSYGGWNWWSLYIWWVHPCMTQQWVCLLKAQYKMTDWSYLAPEYIHRVPIATLAKYSSCSFKYDDKRHVGSKMCNTIHQYLNENMHKESLTAMFIFCSNGQQFLVELPLRSIYCISSTKHLHSNKHHPRRGLKKINGTPPINDAGGFWGQAKKKSLPNNFAFVINVYITKRSTIRLSLCPASFL